MKRLNLILFSSIGIFLVMVGLLFWFSEYIAEERLQDYIETLEKGVGCIVEECPFSSSHVAGKLKMNFFSDFRSFAQQEGINHIYVDKEKHALYFFHQIKDIIVEIVVFYY